MNRNFVVFALPAAFAATAAAASGALFRREPPFVATGFVRQVDGASVHYQDAGEGPAIVLIHGFCGNTFSWRYLLPELARGHRVIALDLPGFGWSDRRPAVPLGHRDHARRIVHLLDALGIDRAVFVGHSMGGAVAQFVAEQDPERVTGLVLVAALNAADREAWRERRMRMRPFLRYGLTIGAHGPAARPVFARALRALVVDPTIVTPEMVNAYLQPLRRRGTFECVVAMSEASQRAAPPDFSLIKAPALVLSADRDTVFSIEAGEKLAQALPDARHVVIARSGHLLPEEQPSAVLEQLRAFLGSLAPA